MIAVNTEMLYFFQAAPIVYRSQGSANRPLNIFSFKKSASHSIGSNAGATNATMDPGSDSSGTTHNQNQNKNLAHGGGSTGLLGRFEEFCQ
jgi:hypothetical protein